MDRAQQITELRKQRNLISQQIEALETLGHVEELSASVGKFYKTRNSYGGDCPGWDLYSHAIELKTGIHDEEPYLLVLRFENSLYFNNPAPHIYMQKLSHGGELESLGQEIVESEWISAESRLMTSIQNLFNVGKNG